MSGILAVFNNVAAGSEAEFNNWYNQQHLIERLQVPGFTRGYRYRAATHDARRRYFAWYETAWPAVMQSAGYLDRLEDPTAWTGRVMPAFRDMQRTVARRDGRAGEGVGGSAATIRLAGLGADAAKQWLLEEGFGKVLMADGMISAELWIADVDLTAIDTTESRMRDGVDDVFKALVLLQAMDADSLSVAASNLERDMGAGKHQLRASEPIEYWQLLFASDGQKS